MEEPTRNSETLASFVEYCQQHPGERFWQALRNWSRYAYVLVSVMEAPHTERLLDTFHFEGRRQNSLADKYVSD